MYAHPRTTAALAALFVLACGAQRDVSRRADAVLSDGRSDGAPGFYFVPPVAPEPGAKENDRGLSPVVEIVALTPDAPVLATFSGDAVKESGAHYMVHWPTKEFPPAAGTTYRVRVLLDGGVLGFADAAVAESGRELRFLASGEIFGVTGQRTVPIKFRIHAVTGDEDGDGIPDGEDLCPTASDPQNLDTDGDGVGDACECLQVTCSPPTQCQLAVTCDSRTGACFAEDRPVGTACEDGNLCTEGDTCEEGACTPGAGLECLPPSECQVGACDPIAGCTFSNVEDGTTCTIGGTLPGACLGGVCERLGPVKITPR